MSDKAIKEGDEVSWKWGNGNPSGTVAEVQEQGQLEIETAGKTVHKNASPSNPAVHVARSGNDVVKRASELTKESDAAPPADDAPPSKSQNGSASGEKRARDDDDDGEGESDESGAKADEADEKARENGNGHSAVKDVEEKQQPAKKQKLDKDADAPAEKNGNAAAASTPPKKRGPGRPKKSESAKKINGAEKEKKVVTGDEKLQNGKATAAAGSASEKEGVEAGSTEGGETPATRTRSKA